MMLHCSLVFLLLCVSSSRAMVDDLTRQLNDADSAKARLTQENFDLQHQVQALDFSNSALVKAKSQLQAQNEHLKKSLHDDRMQRQNLQMQLSQLQADYDNFSHRYDEESEAASTLRTQLSKVNAEFAALRARFEKELMAKTEELEELRHTARTKRPAVDPCDTLRQRNNELEDTKIYLSSQLDQCSVLLNHTQNDVQNLTIRYRELQSGADDLKKSFDELDAMNNHSRMQMSDLEAARHSLELEVDDLQHRNANLQFTNDKLTDEVQALRDAEAELAAARAVLAQLRTEMETRLREKDEEIENIREESAQEIEEVETKYIDENTRLYMKFEAEIRELDGFLDNATKSNTEYLKQIRDLQQRVEELEVLLEEARLNNTIEEDLRTRLDAAERAYKNAENEHAETSARLSAVQIQVTALVNDKRRMETDIIVMESHLEDAINAKRDAEERGDRLGNENMRLADELMLEQENYKNAESLRKQLEIEIHELKIRLEEVEANAAKSVRSVVARLRMRIPSLY